MQSRVLATLVAIVLALVATAALVVYVNSADRRAIRDQQPVVVYVAARKIPTGTSGVDAYNNDMIDRLEVPRRTRAAGAITSVEQLRGRIAAVDIVPGEQLLLERWVGPGQASGRRLLPIPPEHQAVAIDVDLTRQVAGFVTPGDRVSVLVSMKRPPADRPGDTVETTQFLIQDIQVLAVGATAQTTANGQDGGRVAQGRQTQSLAAITLAVEKQDVERLVFAAEHGSIYLSLLPPGQKAIPSDGATVRDAFRE
jgi:pilus assembly protein CpaB